MLLGPYTTLWHSLGAVSKFCVLSSSISAKRPVESLGFGWDEVLERSRFVLVVCGIAIIELTMKILVIPFAAMIPPWMRILIVSVLCNIYIGEAGGKVEKI